MAKKIRTRKKKFRRRPPPPRPRDGRPLLSLAMMVKDEERFLEDALASAKPVVDEMIVVDTGSTDRTVEIARDMGATVSHFDWCDDFSAARNATLERATGHYILVLDADERLRGPGDRAPDADGLRSLLRPGPKHPYEGISLEVVNTRLDGTPMNGFHSVRVFPNDRRLGYRGRVHNAFGPLVDGAPRVSARIFAGVRVMHLGYDPDLYVERKKAERSLPLIERTVAEEPDNRQFRFYLGREYLLLGRLDAAIEQLTRTVRETLRDGSGPLVEATVHLMRAMARAERPAPEMLTLLKPVLELRPDHPDLWLAVARAFALGEQKAAAVDAGERVLKLLDRGGKALDAQSEAAHDRSEVHGLLAGLYWDMQRFPESYRHHLAALDGGSNGPGSARLLHQACALALELGDDTRVPGLLDRLLAHPSAPLGMFFFALDRLIERGETAGARAMLEAARARCARLVDDPEYGPRAARLGL